MSGASAPGMTGAPRLRPDAERRQVTVLFCDLVGSSRLASLLDPEDWRDVLLAYQRSCAGSVERHDGFVAQYLGDAVVATFGHPVASEDAAEQAVRAASDMLRQVAAMVTPAGPVQARTGLATGLAIVGDIVGSGAAEQAAVTGQVAILASRIQAAAAPGVVTIADATRRLIGDVFTCTDLGPHALKGVEEPVRLWAIGAERRHETRYDAAHAAGADGIIGRTQELRTLMAHWSRAAGGQAGAVVLKGEAGIGKSTLLRSLRREVERSGGTAVTFQCSQRHGDSPLYPVICYLQRAAGWHVEDTPAQRLSKLQRFGDVSGLQGEWHHPAWLLGAGGAAPATAAAQEQKRQTLALLLALIKQSASRAPLLLVLEDAHWADPTTQEFIGCVLAAAIPQTLFVAAMRPETGAPWAHDIGSLTLPRLAAGDARTLVERITGDALPPKGVGQILERADGVPLFLQELARDALDGRGAAGLGGGPVAIPMTLRDGLAARLDRLGATKLTAQVAAVLGPTFGVEPLVRVLDRDRDQVLAELAVLQSASLIRRIAPGDGGDYGFSHALLQEAAYDSLLRSTRKALHARAAAALEALRPGVALAEPETLAHHCEAAGEHGRAAAYRLRAGQRAQARAANLEATAQFERGLAALAEVPGVDSRDALELDLQLGLGQVAYVLNGPAHPQTVAAYTRAQALVNAVTDAEQRRRVLWGIFSGYHFASRFDLARAPAHLMLELARRDGRGRDLCQAYRMLGYIDFFLGNHDASVQHFNAVAAHYCPEEQGAHAYQYGADCLVGSRGFHAVIESLTLPYRCALARAETNCAYARTLEHPASLGWAFASMCYVHYFGNDAAGARAGGIAGAQYCEAHNVAAWYPHCRLFELWGRAVLESPAGRAGAAREVMAFAAGGNQLGLSIFRIVLAEILLLDGDCAAALIEARAALTGIEDSGQRIFAEAAAFLHARCMMASLGDTPEVAQLFHDVAEAARQSGTPVIELRALRQLAKMQQPCGVSDPCATVRSRICELEALLEDAHGQPG